MSAAAGSSFDGPPGDDEIEVSVFGPGYGECVLVHAGHGAWLIVDSCEDDRDADLPVVRYLREIGVSLDAVQWIVATHWHDDHVRRLDELFALCQKARLCVSGALDDDELVGDLVAVREPAGEGGPLHLTSGVRAMQELLSAHGDSGRVHYYSESNSLQVLFDGQHDVHVRVLAPSAAAHHASRSTLKRMLQHALQGRDLRVRRPHRNDTAIVLWIEASTGGIRSSDGPASTPRADVVRLLLGADLETRRKKTLGWKAVVDSPFRRPGRATLVKVPHHGSRTGYLRPMWDSMTSHPHAVLTPWQRNKGLPQPDGLRLIARHAGQVHSTAAFGEREQFVAGKRRRTVEVVPARATFRCVLPPAGQQHDASDWRVHHAAPAHRVR